MSEESRPLGGEVLTKPFKVLAGIFGFALLLIAIRYVFGIGAVSNLNDGYPWGIWIAYDVVAGTAIACGGYALALMVYVMNKGEYHALVRPALLASVFGYTLAGASIFVDIGRYWNAYKLFTPWYANPNSIMFEVAFCVSLYIGVLWIEFMPAFLEGVSKYKEHLPEFVRNWNVEGLRKTLNKFMFVFIAVGVLLPTMHQSSLGSLMLIAGKKLSPLWQTGLLPLLFLISAITMGYAIVIFEGIYAAVGFKRPIEMPLLTKISGVMPGLIGVYLAIRIIDLVVRGAVGVAFQINIQSLMFWVENALYVAALVYAAPVANRTKPKPLFLSAFFMLMAGTVYRFNTFLVGFNPGANWSYFPSFSETVITLGMISFEIMAYLYIVKKFPVLPKAEHA
ncbi:MAG: Ni/Fe-hydrogenase cytochrome b subunit [Nitrospirota bacterium]|nr:Ni/Fe-hydrogenase cytochrome b subunit [Nitrospirota bacterium]